MTQNPYQNYLSQLEPCPSCGEEQAFGWCGISIRPYCRNCGEWGYTNYHPNGPEEAIKSWNERSRRAVKRAEREWECKELDNYNKELGVELTIKDLINFHRAHCNLL